MDINELASQLQSAVTLYAEVLVAIFAAAILGLVTGLMMQRSKHRRHIDCTHEVWEEKYNSLEQTSLNDADNLEEQLQSIATEAKTLRSANLSLKDTAKRNDINVQKFRAESIELNRRHTETQERLQRIIQQKDREIAELSTAQGARIFPDNAPHDAATNNIASLTNSLGDDLHAEDTVAISPAQLPSEATPLTKNHSAPNTVNINDTSELSNSLDSSMDETANLAGLGLEDSTIAMTDEVRAYAKKSFNQRKK